MFKRLFVVMLILAFSLSLFSMAMATDDPSGPKGELHKFKETTGAARNLSGNTHVFQRPAPPEWIGPPKTKEAVPQSGPLNKIAPAACSNIEYDCGVQYRITGPTYGQAVRYSTGSEECSPQTAHLLFDGLQDALVAFAGVDVHVWADDGTGLPGASLYSVHVSNANIMLGTSTDVDLTPAALSLGAGTEYHVGWVPSDVSDRYTGNVDNGSCGQGRSSLQSSGTWFANSAVFGGTDYNWTQSLDVCCSAATPSNCETAVYYGPMVYGYWFDAYAVRYQADANALQCQVTFVNFWVEDASLYGLGTTGNPSFGGVDAYVFADDGTGLPGSVLGSIFVDDASIVSGAFNTVDFTTQGLTFPAGTNFHVGWGADVLNDAYLSISDDAGTGAATPGTVQSSIYTDGVGWESTVDFNIGLGYGPLDDNLLISAEVCCDANPQICENLAYHASAFYYWPDPDPFDDTFRNERFSLPNNAGPVCTLKTVRLAFDPSGSVGGPGADVYIWNSDGTFPSTVVTSIPVNPVVDFFPVYTELDISAMNLTVNSDWHVGYATIDNSGVGSDVLAVLSDNGTGSGVNRSSEYWPPGSGGTGYGLMFDNWGLDVDFLIETDVCCVPPGYCPITCSPTDEWPSFGHDFARTSQSEMTIGDLCGVVFSWYYPGPTGINYSGPVISGDLVLQAFDDRVQAVDLLTGSLVWDTKVIGGNWNSTINSALRAMITVKDGYFYFGTGSLRGFAKGDLATGAWVWSRGLVAPGGPLPGTSSNTRFAGSIIQGSEVYFGNEAGQIYALDAGTGASLYNASVAAGNTNGGTGGIYGPPSTDGTQIFWAVTENLFSATVQNGVVVSTSQGGGSFVVNWVYDTPFDGLLNLGVSGGTSYRCDNIYINANYAFGNFSTYNGLRKKIDAATGADAWPDNFLMGATYYDPPSTTNEAVYYGQWDEYNNGSVNARGVRAVNFNNSTVWLNGPDLSDPDEPYTHEVLASVSVTCDPYAIYTTTDGVSGNDDWYIVDGNTGAELVKYHIPNVNIGHYTAIAMGSDGSPYFVVSAGGYSASGELFAWKIGGPRPRLAVPSSFVMLPGTNTSESAPVQRTHTDAILNTGCANLNYSATLEAGSPPSANVHVTTVHPDMIKYADRLSNQIVDVTVGEMMGRNSSYFNKNLTNVSFSANEYGEVANRTVYTPKAAASDSRSSALAPPTWVTWVTPPSGGATVAGTILPGDGADWTFEFDRSGMNFLAPNTFFVEVSSDDPDYGLGTPADDPRAVIQYSMPYEYCPVETGFMQFGTDGQEWYSNRGEIGDAAVNQDFSISVGGGDDHLYEGTMFFMTSMDDAAWNLYGSTVPTDFGFLYPFYVGPYVNQDCGGCDFGVALPVEYTTDGGNSYANTQGDLCTFAMIDSLQGAGLWPQQAGPAMGLKVSFREVGTYGADFDGFKVIVADLENRNASALNGLYYGCFIDWDIATDGGFADPAAGYHYQIDPVTGDVNGVIGLPLAGSYWPDGTKTDPMYNARTVDNATSVYPSGSCGDCILDSLFAWVDGNPDGGFYYEPDDAATVDKSSLTAFGKTDLAGFGFHTYGFALYGINGTVDANGETATMAAFVNKYVGFARGDVNDDGVIDLRDLVRLSNFIASGNTTNGPEPFLHLGDVNNDGNVDSMDCAYLAAYYFTGGPPPQSAFVF